jgi:hypothetical protein
MWEPQHLTTIWALTACYRDKLTIYLSNEVVLLCSPPVSEPRWYPGCGPLWTSLMLRCNMHAYVDKEFGFFRFCWTNGLLAGKLPLLGGVTDILYLYLLSRLEMLNKNDCTCSHIRTFLGCENASCVICCLIAYHSGCTVMVITCLKWLRLRHRVHMDSGSCPRGCL